MDISDWKVVTTGIGTAISILGFWQRQRLSRYFSPTRNLVICESEKSYLAQALLDILEMRDKVGSREGSPGPQSPLTELARKYATSSKPPGNSETTSSSGSSPINPETGEAWRRRSSDKKMVNLPEIATSSDFSDA